MNTIVGTTVQQAPVSEALLERARAAVRQYYALCFWFRHPEAPIETAEDVRLIIRHLREYGDQKAWKLAQELHKCL